MLWLFGWVMFLGSHDDSVDKHMIRYAWELTELEVEVIQPYAWGRRWCVRRIVSYATCATGSR